MQEHLGFRVREVTELHDGRESGAWMSVTVQAHELIYVIEELPTHGRFHHAAFWVDSREEVLRAADIFADAGVFIEAGPGKHTVIGGVFLYVYEPGGNRIEVTNGGYLAFDPDARPFVWSETEFSRGPAWATPIPATFRTYGTPPVELEQAASA
jgi:catechol 2,3-dioxygenase